MFTNATRVRLRKLVAPALLALICGSHAFGFGGHPQPPAPPGPPPIPQDLPAQPGDGGGVAGGSPAEDEIQIPTVLLKPEQNEVIEPVFEGGGETDFPPPPGPDNANETPEPATLLMGLLGAGALVGARAWKRRRKT